jgi:hypothetical protein
MGNLDWLIGKEIIAFGLGLDISGAIFLALSLLESSSSMASKLFYDDSKEKKINRVGKKEHLVSGTPIKEAAKSMLLARIGLFSLVAGFIFQLIGTIVPSTDGIRIFLPLFSACLAFDISRRVGKKWIKKNISALMEHIIRSPRVDSTIDIHAVRFKKREYNWKEPRLIKFLRNRFTEN